MAEGGCLKLVPEYEQTARKIADYRNHLTFGLTYRQNGIIPKSLQMKLSVQGHRANKGRESGDDLLHIEDLLHIVW